MMSPGGRALLIGINSYPHLGRSLQLRGAVNDVRAMAGYLREALGFKEEDVRLLVDAEATRSNILSSIDSLVDETAEGDLVVVHYSGHGSRMNSPEGRAGEAHEETLVPYDTGRNGAPNRDITSLELRHRFLRLSEKTLRLTLVFDCCHSGTLSRDPFAARARWVPSAEAPPRPRPEGVDAAPSPLPYNRRYTLVAACRRDESAYEVCVGGGDPLHHGALTHHLLTELRKAAAKETWRSLMESVTIGVNLRFRNQHPQLEGAVDREIFGSAERRPMRYLRVIGADEERRRVVLDGGAVLGVGRRSRWMAYPPNTENLEQGAQPLAEVEVCAVRATTADADLVGREARCPPVGARLVETRLGDAAVRFRVEAVSQVADQRWLRALAEEVEAHPLLEWCEGLESGNRDARVYFLGARTIVAAGDPVPSWGPIREPVYAAVGVGGELLMPVRPLTGQEAIVTLVQNLVARARWLQGCELRQRDDSTLAGQVRFEILRQRNGDWIPISPDDSTFTDGERFAVELEHHHGRSLFFYVLNFSSEGEIGLVYPARGARVPVKSRYKVRYGDAEGDRVSFTLSHHFPYENPGGPTEATEVLKLFALEEETDFRPLFQGRYRQIRGWRSLYQRSLLGQRLCQLMIGDRDLRRVEAGVQRPWTTLERQVVIRRSSRRPEE